MRVIVTCCRIQAANTMLLEGVYKIFEHVFLLMEGEYAARLKINTHYVNEKVWLTMLFEESLPPSSPIAPASNKLHYCRMIGKNVQ